MGTNFNQMLSIPLCKKCFLISVFDLKFVVLGLNFCFSSSIFPS